MTHTSHARWLALLLGVLLGISSLSAAGWDDAVDDDLYYSPTQAAKAEKKRAEERAEAARKARLELEARYARQDSMSAAYNAAHPVQGLDVSDDAYNRRLNPGTAVADSAAREQLEFGQTYSMTRRIERFHNENVVADTEDSQLISDYYGLDPDRDITICNVYIDPTALCYGAYSPYYTPYSWYSPYYGPGFTFYSWRPYANYWGWWDFTFGWGPTWGAGWGPDWGPGWGNNWGPAWGPAHPAVRPGGFTGGGGRPSNNYTPTQSYRPGGNVSPSGHLRPGNMGRPGSTVSSRPGSSISTRPGSSVSSRPGSSGSNRVNNTGSSSRPSKNYNNSGSSHSSSSARPGGFNSGSNRGGSFSGGSRSSGGHSSGGGRGRR